ncbi:MAG TPA: helix-turn-helix domain-containing protein [Prosthecobacter sp.]|nr:helix-turn-helix domain-containing protein [Prosthecobacter sp.]
MKEILTVEACRILRVNKKTLYTWADNHVLKVKRSGPLKIRVFDEDEVLRLSKRLPKKRGRSVRILPPPKPRKS